MNATDYVELAVRMGIDRAMARAFVHKLFVTMAGALYSGKSAALPLVGALSVYTRKPRQYYHPKAGGLFKASAKRGVRFSLASSLKQALAR